MSSKVATSAAASAAAGMIKLSPSVYFLPPLPPAPGRRPTPPPADSVSSLSASTTTLGSISDIGKDSVYSAPSADSTTTSGSSSSASSDSGSAAVPRRDPGLILLGTWMGAAPKHIQKYTDAYRHLFPSSPILLVRSEPTDFMKPRAARENLRPAARLVEAYASNPLLPLAVPSPVSADAKAEADSSGVSKDLLKKTGLDKPERSNAGGPMLVHVWSNGGSNSLWGIRRQSSVFPRYKLIMDSCPGQFHYKATFTAFSLTIPYPWLRRLLAPLIHFMCCWFWLRLRMPGFSRLIGGEGQGGPLRLSADSHNDPKLLGVDRGRTYIYSDEDALVPSADVEEHAHQAIDRGFNVRLEKFKGSQHVAHAKKDPERYWRLVRQTWNGGLDGEGLTPQQEQKEKQQLDNHYRDQAQA